jgi:hypothetical protein
VILGEKKKQKNKKTKEKRKKGVVGRNTGDGCVGKE